MVDFINPGSGPVEGATEANAQAAVEQFTADLRAAGSSVSACVQTSAVDDEGRWAFDLTVDGTKHFVEMPGLPIDQIRYQGQPGQNAFQYARIYVDGSSWLWPLAMNASSRQPGD